MIQSENISKAKVLKKKINNYDTFKVKVFEMTADTNNSSNEISRYMQENAGDILNEVTTAVG